MFRPNEITTLAAPPRRRYAWHELEEYLPDGGMWKEPRAGQAPVMIADSAALMADPGRFYEAMLSALSKWPRSCESAMTTPGLNRLAWLGHAGCYLATGSVESATRLGWHELTPEQQRAANSAAQQVVNEWEKRQGQKLNQGVLWGDR